jgi:hypothetical protein
VKLKIIRIAVARKRDSVILFVVYTGIRVSGDQRHLKRNLWRSLNKLTEKKNIYIFSISFLWNEKILFVIDVRTRMLVKRHILNTHTRLQQYSRKHSIIDNLCPNRSRISVSWARLENVFIRRKMREPTWTGDDKRSPCKTDLEIQCTAFYNLHDASVFSYTCMASVSCVSTDKTKYQIQLFFLFFIRMYDHKWNKK